MAMFAVNTSSSPCRGDKSSTSSMNRQAFEEPSAASIQPSHSAPAFLSPSRSSWTYKLTHIYHEYGLRHVLLLLTLITYAFIGAAVFNAIERPKEIEDELEWNRTLNESRWKLVENVILPLVNNASASPTNSAEFSERLFAEIREYEFRVGLRRSKSLGWDFWNAQLYSWTVITTIGYGHLYPTTNAGRIATMIYAIIGMPLLLTTLNDLGKLLTKVLKYPWLLLKKFLRRVFRCCTHKSWEQIHTEDQKDLAKLHIFDLPVPVAILIVIGWIFLCSATFCLWESDWDYLVAFYFFFISLSTIGLGDIIPNKPTYLLFCFGYIIIGLSLLSMCINLIQSKLEKIHAGGRRRRPSHQDRIRRLFKCEPNGTVSTALSTAAMVSLYALAPSEEQPRRSSTSKAPKKKISKRTNSTTWSLKEDKSCSSLSEIRATLTRDASTKTRLLHPPFPYPGKWSQSQPSSPMTPPATDEWERYLEDQRKNRFNKVTFDQVNRKLDILQLEHHRAEIEELFDFDRSNAVTPRDNNCLTVSQ